MRDSWIKYSGMGFPVSMGSMVEIKCHPDDAGGVLIKSGKLVSYESYEINSHTTAYSGGFYWKLDDQDDYFNFNCSEIDCYRIIKSSIPESPFPELTVCKDLIWTMFHGGSTDAKYRGISHLRRECNLRNSEICDLTGLKSEDIDFILDNKEC